MSIPIFDAATLRKHVTFHDLIEPINIAFQEYSDGLADAGTITMFPAKHLEWGDVYVKTGNIHGHKSYIVKISPWFAANVEANQPQGGFIAVFDSETGRTRALLAEDHYLSDIRTASAGALAARFFAPHNVRTATVLGTGVQAFWQPQALYRERPYKHLNVWGRHNDKVQKLIKQLEPLLPNVLIKAENNLERAARAADVIMTTTSSREPILQGAWLHSGQHITAIGADDATKCELDAECLLRANRLIVDSVESSQTLGDISRHLKQGNITPQQIHGEVGAVFSGKIPGRRNENEITIAKFVGLGIQDLIAAEVSLSKLHDIGLYTHQSILN
jgi:ornithine cyclodeaminase/alanine dehydrogenase-like protein (mu-crystallin family)